jgi:hypothetical protein
MRTWNPIAPALAAALLVGGPSLAVPPTDAQKCEAAFELASAKFVRCRLTAESKFTKTGDGAKLTTALATCSTKLSDALGKAVTKYGAENCTAEEPAAFDAYLTQCSNDVEAASRLGGAFPRNGGPLTNGGIHIGDILPGDSDEWTFTADAGERIAVHIGEVAESDDFRPWIRLLAPDDSELGNTSGLAATAIDGAVAPVTGTYRVLVASFDSGFDGAGSYRLSVARTSGAITVTAGDEGGPLTNGGIDTGEILRGDLDVWTFTATAGERVAVHVGEIADTDDLRPWIRVWAPNGAALANTSGVAAAAVDGAVAPVTGTYLVLVASFDSGFDGTGTYRLSVARTSGAITVTAGDEGGPLTNGGIDTGEILRGELDVWTFAATAGERIAVHAGEIADTDDLRPWIRVWAPNGAELANTSGVAAAAVDGAVAPVTGTYLVLVASFDSGFDGTGTYRLTFARTSGAITVSAGDQGGPLSSGVVESGEILRGDLDVWTVSAVAGQLILVHIDEIIDNDDFRPWIRLWAPTGSVLASASGLAAADISGAVAPVTGTYLVLVATFDSGFDGTGTYQVTATVGP